MTWKIINLLLCLLLKIICQKVNEYFEVIENTLIFILIVKQIWMNDSNKEELNVFMIIFLSLLIEYKI